MRNISQKSSISLVFVIFVLCLDRYQLSQYLSHLKKDFTSDDQYHPLTFIVTGLVISGLSVSVGIKRFIVEVSCKHQIVTIIVTKDDGDILEQNLNHMMRLKFPGANCAPLFIRKQPDEISKIRHRVQRIKHLRELQRAQVMDYVSSYKRAVVDKIDDHHSN